MFYVARKVSTRCTFDVICGFVFGLELLGVSNNNNSDPPIYVFKLESNNDIQQLLKARFRNLEVSFLTIY